MNLLKKKIATLAVGLSMLSAFSVGSASSGPVGEIMPLPISDCSDAARKQFLIEVEFLSGADIDGAKLSSMVFENMPGAVGVAITTEAERTSGKPVDGTTVEFTPTKRRDGRIGVELKATRAGKTLFEGCSVAGSGKRVVIAADEISIAVTVYDPDETSWLQEIMDKYRQKDGQTACSDKAGVDK